MNVLGVDTSFLSDTSIGLYFSEDNQLEINLRIPLSQEEKLLFSINSAFEIINRKIEEIELFSIGIGPGSFTGLRIGISVVKALAWSLSKPVVGISSLELLSHSIPQEIVDADSLVIPVVDARMNKVFVALFNKDGRIMKDMDIRPDEVVEIVKKRKEKKFIFIGDGINKYEGVFLNIDNKEKIMLKDGIIRGITICQLGIREYSKRGASEVKTLSPAYLRKSEAEEKLKEQQQLFGKN